MIFAGSASAGADAADLEHRGVPGPPPLSEAVDHHDDGGGTEEVGPEPAALLDLLDLAAQLAQLRRDVRLGDPALGLGRAHRARAHLVRSWPCGPGRSAPASLADRRGVEARPAS